MLVSAAAASDPDVRLLVARWLPLPLDRAQPGAYDLSSGRFLRKGKTFFQSTPKGARGAISFLPDGRTLIQLFERADLSTVLHESGYLFLEVLRQVATAENAPEALRHDWQTVLDWLGVPEGSAIGRDQHEQWARGFEAYLMEGKAPSLALQSVFDRFRAWLTRIYRTLKGLNVELNDDIRRVFDRMLASDAEIETAEAASRFTPLLADPAGSGMTPAEHAAYLARAEKATAEAKRTLIARAMADIRRERTAAGLVNVVLLATMDGGTAWEGELVAAATAREAVMRLLMDSAAALTGCVADDPRDRPRGCMVALSWVGSEGHAELGELVRAARAVTLDRLKLRLERAIAEGEMPVSTDIHALARFVQTVQNGMSILARDGAARSELEAVAQLAMQGWDARSAQGTGGA